MAVTLTGHDAGSEGGTRPGVELSEGALAGAGAGTVRLGLVGRAGGAGNGTAEHNTDIGQPPASGP